MKKKQNLKFQVLLICIFVVLSIFMLLPLYVVVAVSLSNESAIAYRGYSLLPNPIDFTAYKFVFKNPTSIIEAYKVTINSSLLYMVLSVILMSMLAYPLSQKSFKGRKIINFAVYFTMLFQAGLVPTYILYTQYLHLGNTFWIYIFTGLISPWYVFMLRTFFTQLPESLHEAAMLDGLREMRYLWTIVFPLSKPSLAAVALFMFLNKWNDWFTAMMYVDDPSLYSLQYLLQRIMNNIQILQNSSNAMSTAGASELAKIPTETVRMAMAVIVAGPALLVFPFFQKYFVKGLTVGSVKG